MGSVRRLLLYVLDLAHPIACSALDDGHIFGRLDEHSAVSAVCPHKARGRFSEVVAAASRAVPVSVDVMAASRPAMFAGAC